MATNNDHYVSYRLTLNTDRKKGGQIDKVLSSLDSKDRQTFMCLAVDLLCKKINYEVPEDILEVYEAVCHDNVPNPQPSFTDNTRSFSERVEAKQAPVCEPRIEMESVNTIEDTSSLGSSISDYIMGTLDSDEFE